MKKFFIFILLLVVTVACLSACDMADNNSDEQFPTSPTETNEPKEEAEPPSELFCDLSEISVWTDKDGEFYVYVKAWDAYRKMSGLKDWNKFSIIIDHTSTVISEKTGAIAVICQSGWSDTVITTYHFNVENDNVQAYTALLETEVNCEPNYYFINLYDQECGYFFFLPESLDSHTSVAWPLIRYETTDGGKTWNKVEETDFGHAWNKYPTIVQFISHEVGIISFRYHGTDDLCKRTYLTTDGGLTWNRISALPFPYDNFGYAEVRNFEQGDDGYVLTVEVYDCSYSEIIQFKSDDLTNWVCITSVSEKLFRISKHQARNSAEHHWGVFTGDISDNGFVYRIDIVATPTYTAPYYVADLSWLVDNHHYSLVERIFIDATSGECTIEYDMDNIVDAYKKMLVHKNEYGNVSDAHKNEYPYISTRIFEELMDIVSKQNVYSAAYAQKDLNGDGKDELILLDRDWNIWGIFTKVNDIPILVSDFNNTNSFAAIDETGVIYTNAYTKGETTHNGVWQLSTDGALKGLGFGCIDYTGFSDDAVVSYYKSIDGKEFDITKEEYSEIESEYSHIFRNFNTTTKSSGIEVQYIPTANVRATRNMTLTIPCTIKQNQYPT